ncbi:hypothetical protein Bca101_043032 [Brassica carinata]
MELLSHGSKRSSFKHSEYFEDSCDVTDETIYVDDHLRLIDGQQHQQRPILETFEGTMKGRVSVHLQLKELPEIQSNGALVSSTEVTKVETFTSDLASLKKEMSQVSRGTLRSPTMATRLLLCVLVIPANGDIGPDHEEPIPTTLLDTIRQTYKYKVKNPVIIDDSGSNIVPIFKVENSGLGTNSYASGSVEATEARQASDKGEAKRFRHGN